MKQVKWYPTKHQVLCSDHFTPDSFNIRWGVRYLKHNAIPTVFSFQDQIHLNLNASSEEGTIGDKKESVMFCRPKVSTSQTQIVLPTLSNDANIKQPHLLNLTNNNTILNLGLKEVHCQQSRKIHQVPICQRMNLETYHATTSPIPCLISDHDNVGLENQTSEQDGFMIETLTLLQRDHRRNAQEALEYEHLDSVSQTIEQLGTPEGSVVSIVVQGEASDQPPPSTLSVIANDHHYTNTAQPDLESAGILESEHSYCRQELSRDQLRDTIAQLKSKIALLEVQENTTLSRLKSLETFIKQLKKENLLSAEKLKIVEKCFSSFDIAIV
ncbi:THAP domain-containing protein 5 [Spea bombifrons]|uniref:THAP domain-containing protein 5 n=1 Tax=Spea bombifrons TaxID=233779 RepID=UPI002349DBB6|nr:THAP domain-containing protein 5 [Spea bombifrons]XP_053320948.1 THAP domain-containing protein 5 [Spea bombifrons]